MCAISIRKIQVAHGARCQPQQMCPDSCPLGSGGIPGHGCMTRGAGDELRGAEQGVPCRVTQNLPLRCHALSPAERFQTFVRAIFYVGKGKRARPYSHLYEALAHYRGGKKQVWT